MVGLSLENITHAFDGNVVVDNVSLRVDPGEVICLVGPSGCGKSTTLRIAAGLEEVQQGQVIVNDKLVGGGGRHVPPELRGVGLVFQDYALFPHLKVLENVAFGITDGRSSDTRKQAARAMLEKVGLSHLENAFPHTLSGGEQQRVALARALAPRPGLMLMDEPFSGLDIGLRDKIRDDTLALLKELGAATLLVTHDPEEAMRMADRVALMREGRLVQEGPPNRVYSNPDSPFCCTFFSNVNRLESIVDNGLAKTTLGIVEANEIGNGVPVDVLVRPEAIKIHEPADGAVSAVDATVVSSRVLGPYSLVYLQAASDGRVFEARLAGIHAPDDGTRCTVTLDPSQVFVFPASSN
tara:strand:+ start:622 stop:1680 length:1059 start_codon:yes stop_codon:yes gene_type:complete